MSERLPFLHLATSPLRCAIALLALGGAGCSLLLPSKSTQCEVDADCAKGGSGLACSQGICVAAGNSAGVTDPAWSCYFKAAPKVDPGVVITLTMNLRDIVTNTAVSGASVKLCNALDLTCAPAGLPLGTSDDRGQIRLPVPNSFVGYARISAAGYMPTLSMIDSVLRPGEEIRQIALISPENYQLLATSVGVSVNPEASLFTMRIDPCDELQGKFQVILERSNADTVVGYTANNLPSFSATAATERQALAANVPVGVQTLRVFLPDVGRDLKSFSIILEKGANTNIYQPPPL